MAGVNSSLLHPSRVRQVRPPAQAQMSMPRASSATPSMAHGSASPASAVSMVPSQPFLHSSSTRAKIRRPSFGPSHSPKPVSSQKVASMSYSPSPGHSQMPFGPQQVSSYTPPPGAPHASCVGHAGTTPNTGFDSLRAKSVPPQRANEEEQRYGPNVDVEMGEYRFRCINVLGRGSYSEVWRAEVTSPCIGFSEAALKEVRCSSQAELQQAIFEVQVLLALECSSGQPLRVPRCIAYKVDPCQAGWKVRTAMTVVPGEALDVFVRRTPPEGFTHQAALQRGVALATKMIRDIGPTLQLLAPIAWHRDVNSHNILIDKAPENASVEELSSQATFWLIDFGLAVDSQSWVTSNGRWRTEYIGGDSRYWPPSSWIMHLLGPDGFEGEEQLCEQYQRRLDIHGLGITALELLCTIALASPPEDGAEQQPSQGAWIELFTAWQQYRDDVWRWWSAVYSVFSTGADIAPVQAQLVQDRIIEQLIVLLSNIRSALRRLAKELHDDRASARLLDVIADMIDEGSSFELANLEQEFADVPISKPGAAMPFQHAPSSHGYDLSYNSQNPGNESVSPVPTRGPSMQSPLRGMVNSGSCSNAMTAAAAASAANSGRRQVHSLAREAAQSLESDGRGRTGAPWYHRSIDSNGAHIGYIRAGPSAIDTQGKMAPQRHSRNPSLERVHVRHLGVERPCSPVRLQTYERPSQASVSPVRLRPCEHSPDRARSPIRVQFDRARSPVWTHSTRVPSLEREPQVPQAASHLPPWTGVLLPATMPVTQQRAVGSRVGISPGRHSPSAPLGRRRLDASAGTSGGSWVARGQDGVSEWSASPAGGSTGISVMPLTEAAHGSSPRLKARMVLDAGPAVSTSSLSMRCATLQQGGSQKADIGLAANNPAPMVSPWLPAPRERNLVPGGPDLTSVGPGQSSSPSFGVGAVTPRAPAHISSLTSQNRSGDGDIGAGPPNPHASAGATSVNTSSNASASASVDSSQEALRARIRSLEASGNEHEKLRERIKNLEESLQRLGKESLERAKLGMEKLAEKYFPHTPSDDVFDSLPRSSALDGPYMGTAFPSDFIIPQRMAT